MVVAMLFSLTFTIVSAIKGGVQSGPSPGNFYSGGMAYAPVINRLYLTGSHYNTGIQPYDGSNNDLMQGTSLDKASSCYIAEVDFEKVVSSRKFHSMSNWASYGNPGKIETCAAVAATSPSDVYVVGSVGEGGLFSDGYPMQGLLSVMNKETLGFLDAPLIKSAEDPETHMIYPLDVIHDHGRNHVYVAALTSTDNTVNEITGNQKQPNWQEQHLIGSSFDVTIIKIRVKPDEKPSALWVKHFPLDMEPDGSRPPVFVAGMALQRDSIGIQHLFVTGSTRGTGEAFGRAAEGSTDEDGFIMQLSLKDGTFMQHRRHQGTDYDFKGELREGTGSDDFIRGMCNNRGRGQGVDAVKIPSDVFYIVGGTKGDMTTNEQGEQNINDNAGFQFGAGVESKYKDTWERGESLMPFLRQVRVSDLKPVWTAQWAAMPNRASEGTKLPTNAFAMDCFVDNDKEAVYVVGSVKNGDSMTQGDVEMVNQGGDDLWVAKVDEKTGNVFWLTQLGSTNDEKPARHGSIIVNTEGNVLIYGDTDGSLYRPRGPDESPGTFDMFLMTVDGKTGAVLDDYYMGGTSSGTVAEDISGIAPLVPVPAPNLPEDDRTPAPISGSMDDKKFKNDDDDQFRGNNNRSEKKSKVGLVFGVILAITAALAALFFFYSQQMKKRKAEAQKSSIFACLQQFDVEDIDLRRSPPGGWHGTYMNKLAYGHNSADDVDDVPGQHDMPSSPVEGAPLTHSSVAKDALFMDDTAAATSAFQIDEEDDVDIRLNAKTEIV